MVAPTQHDYLLSDGRIDQRAWLDYLAAKGQFDNTRLVERACQLASCVDHTTPCDEGHPLQSGLACASILADLDLDQPTLAATILYYSHIEAELPLETIEEALGDNVAKLIQGTLQMDLISAFHPSAKNQYQQVSNLRRMLIAMVDDVRIVLIRLAIQLHSLRHCSQEHLSVKQALAQQTFHLYAPLANRLGIGQIKWELEDLSFRYLKPEEYQNIAKGLNKKRATRDNIVQKIVDELKKSTKEAQIQPCHVYGRAKHIYSIYRKMQQKQLDLKHMYDRIAVRVLVEKTSDCYEVLSLVHARWEALDNEFDDYIVQPKPNGYQSLHTSVRNTKLGTFEVQIRTYDMHEQAELGVAAHWKYKDPTKRSQDTYQRKLAWLREVLSWQKTLIEQPDTPFSPDSTVLDDRVYVFTPQYEVIELPKGATPLDFAYSIHSEVGHRCRGAKIQDRIVPLTYELQMGDQVEILTSKQLQPRQDWLSPQSGYLKTARARAKVQQWFRQAAMAQETHKTLSSDPKPIQRPLKQSSIRHKAKSSNYEFDNVTVYGLDNLLTHLAHCCQPTKGDSIIGYITQGRGIAIHRQSCRNILNTQERYQKRLITVDWE